MSFPPLLFCLLRELAFDAPFAGDTLMSAEMSWLLSFILNLDVIRDYTLWDEKVITSAGKQFVHDFSFAKVCQEQPQVHTFLFSFLLIGDRKKCLSLICSCCL